MQQYKCDVTPSELEIENSHNQEWSGTSTKFLHFITSVLFLKQWPGNQMEHTVSVVAFWADEVLLSTKDCNPWDKLV